MYLFIDRSFILRAKMHCTYKKNGLCFFLLMQSGKKPKIDILCYFDFLLKRRNIFTVTQIPISSSVSRCSRRRGGATAGSAPGTPFHASLVRYLITAYRPALTPYREVFT